MHRKSTAEQLRDDLRDFVDAVVPEVESAVHTVAEKAPPLINKGRAVAVEKGAQAATSLTSRVPDTVLDRLPDTVSDRLPQPRRKRGKAFLVLGAIGLLGGAAALAARRGQASSPAPSRPAPAGPAGSSYPRPVDSETSEADPSDPLVEPRVDGTQA
ncbi:hypothetical protein FHP29_11285 [Nocardioides albidus]|uniref:DUF3618 domain-containing protein n=1 Tax=Nocardioides albidus TaxID=1517589 RepID=A0A5C4VVP5_9ACTN|nr:hypothetical protein [Nocardioides albidus]TNM39475.1 hypothetical protein FHP29_11285 [Nocardioides albidus]